MTETEDNVEDIRMEADEDDNDIMVHNEVNHDSIENDKIHEDNQLLKNKKLPSMSLKDADKQRQSIKSVTQKLKRETAITNIPYHKSKIFTLKEFMSRKTIVKSKHILQQINKQELLYVAKPKMDCNQLEKYSKYLEKRAKEIKSTTVITTPDKNDENDLNDGDDHDDKEMRYSDTITKVSDENFPTLTNFEIEKDETKPIEINLDDKKPIIKSLSISEIAKISNTTKKYEEKPENSRIKLKKQLKRLIAQKREIEIKKKIENKFKEDKTEFEKNEEYDGDDDYDGEDEEEEENDNYSDVENDEESNKNIKVGKNWNKIDEINEENNEQDVEIENDEINTEDLEDIDTNIPTLSSSPSYKQKNIINDNILMSQMPKNTQTLGEDDEEELANLCSGTFSMNAKRDQESSNCRKLEITSEDESYDDNVSSKKKPRKRLVISDDSASDDEDTDDDGDDDDDDDDESKAVNFENNSEKNQQETDEEECETYIDYDSEENEIEVKLTKNECLEKAGDFLEKEAELSESEWNSADEDEKDLDKYDMELGDEDEFDADKLRDEIGRIHMRKILDEDIREVKKIQEMIFDDEENDGIGRQRQFRWNVNDNDFLSVNNNDQTQLAEGIIDDEDEQEKFCRKIRYEREQLLKEKMEHQIQKETEQKLELQGIGGKKLTIMSKTKSCIQSDNFSSKKLESSFLITKIEKKNVMRRSFLERDQEILPKLCSLTNNEAEDEISHKKSTNKYRNFVFPVLSGNNDEI